MSGAHNQIGLGLATVTVAGNMIGSGIYLLPATLAAIGSISIFGWIIVTIGALILAGVFSLIFAIRPTEDGLASIAGEGMGPFWGYQSSLLYWAVCAFGNISIALAVTGYLTVFMPFIDTPIESSLATILAIWLLTLVAIIGPRAIGRTHGVTLAVGLIPLFAAGLLGWLWFDPHVFAASWNISGDTASEATFASLLLIFWAFAGVECAAMVARMVKNPKRNVPLATVGGVVLSALVYMSASTAMFGIIPAAELAASSAPFALVVGRMFGPALAGFVAICAILKVSGTLGGWILVTGETTRWTAAGGFMPRWLERVRGDGSPVRALVFVGLVMTATVILTTSPTINEQFQLMIEITGVLLLVVYIYAAIALIRFSRDCAPGLRRLCIATAIPAILFSAFLLATSGTRLLLLTAGFLLLTVPLWFVIKRHKGTGSG